MDWNQIKSNRIDSNRIKRRRGRKGGDGAREERYIRWDIGDGSWLAKESPRGSAHATPRRATLRLRQAHLDQTSLNLDRFPIRSLRILVFAVHFFRTCTRCLPFSLLSISAQSQSLLPTRPGTHGPRGFLPTLNVRERVPKMTHDRLGCVSALDEARGCGGGGVQVVRVDRVDVGGD